MEHGKVVYPSNRRTFGFILLIFSTIRLLLTYGTFKNAWYHRRQHPSYSIAQQSRLRVENSTLDRI